jgi:diguanylate cyclase (GGDEF)-like protein
MIVLPHTDNKAACILGDRITNCLKRIMVYDDNEIEISISGGICSWDRDLDVREMVTAADKLLYKAKKEGRNLLCLC